jgi:hypothetical protein
MSTPKPLDMPGPKIGGAGPYPIAVYSWHSVLGPGMALELIYMAENRFFTIYLKLCQLQTTWTFQDRKSAVQGSMPSPFTCGIRFWGQG